MSDKYNTSFPLLKNYISKHICEMPQGMTEDYRIRFDLTNIGIHKTPNPLAHIYTAFSLIGILNINISFLEDIF